MRVCAVCLEDKDDAQYSPSILARPPQHSVRCRECLSKKSKKIRRMNGIKSGYIYIIQNPAWPGWLKIGITTKQDINERLASYQTSSPLGDFYGYIVRSLIDVFHSEKEIHTLLAVIAEDTKREWFLIAEELAYTIISDYKE